MTPLPGFGFETPDEAWLTRVRRALTGDDGASDTDSIDRDDRVGERMGPFKLVRRVGAGGMGIVWLAHRVDGEFDQIVAIKLIKRGMDSEEIVRRFRHERQVLASLNHPNIARLLDGGAAEDGRPFLVMEFVDGLPIHHYCRENDLGVDRILEMVSTVCNTVHFAHSNLVVHRDLKPSNILITPEGKPKLLDFGIAKLLDPECGADAPATLTGHLVLTPRYASPEQVRGESITTASDVYSLGVILYELLTGCFPYEVATDSRRELECAILEQEPTRPSSVVARMGRNGTLTGSKRATRSACRAPALKLSRLQKRLRGDLDTIVLTSLRKEPQRRYSSAGDLASDITRFLRNDPIAARPDTGLYRAGKFVRRNRTLVTAVATIFGVVSAALLMSLALYARTEDARAIAVNERDAAEWNLYVASIAAADGALGEVYYPRKAIRHLNRAPQRFRAWEWDFLVSQIDRSLIDMAPTSTGDRKIRIAWQPHGHLLASGEGEVASALRIYDGRSGQLVVDLGRIHETRINQVAFSPDGERLATIARDGSLTLWGVHGNEVQLQFKHTFQFPATGFVFGRDGRMLYVRGQDGSVRAFAVEQIKLSSRWSFQSDLPTTRVLSNVNDANVLVVGLPTSLIVLDASTGDELRSTDVTEQPGQIHITDGAQIVVLMGNDVVTWDLLTMEVVDSATIRTAGKMQRVQFHPVHRLIALQPQNADHFVLGNLDTASAEASYHGYREYGIVAGLAFSDDGERVAVASWERTLETWDLSGTPCVRRLQWIPEETGVSEHFSSIDTLADGSLIVAGSPSGVSLWEPHTGVRVRTFKKPKQGVVNCVRFHPDGHRTASVSNEELDVWDVYTGARLWTLAGASTHRESIDASPNGEYLAFVDASKGGGIVHLCDWRTGEIVRTYPRPRYGARCVEFSPDGKYLACGTSGDPLHDSRVVIWDVKTGDLVGEFAGLEKNVEAVAWSPDGSVIAACGYSRSVWLWSTIDGTELPGPSLQEGAWRSFDISFTPDGRRLTVANTSRTLRLWDLEHAQEIIGLGFVNRAQGITMPDDQRWIATAGRWVITIWDTASPAERVVGEVVRRRYDETPGDWPTITKQLEIDRWLTDVQRAEAIKLVQKLQRYMVGAGDSLSSDTAESG